MGYTGLAKEPQWFACFCPPSSGIMYVGRWALCILWKMEDPIQVLTHFGERSGALYQLSHLPAIVCLLKAHVFIAETT